LFGLFDALPSHKWLGYFQSTPRKTHISFFVFAAALAAAK
jgi:hypothetical protein